jgi:hypothetical protein
MQDPALSAQITVAVVSTYALQLLKQSKFFPWLTVETQTLNRIAGSIIALLTSVGILVTFSAGTLMITGLTPINLAHAAAHFIQQWVMQQVAYKTVVAPPMPGAMQPGAEQHPPVISITPDPDTAKDAK